MLPPGPGAMAISQLRRWIVEPVEVLSECVADYGDTFTLRLPVRGGIRRQPVVVTCHPEAIRQVFTGPADVYHAGKANEILRPLVGEHSLLLLDGPRHLDERRLLLPPFHGERMRAYTDIMRDETLAEMSSWTRDTDFALHPHLQAITLRVILRTVFGVRDLHLDDLAGALTEVLDAATNPAILALALAPLKWRERLRFERYLRKADRLIYRLIRERRREGTHEHRDDVLSMLLSARYQDGSGLSDQALRDELITLLVAGHETTATALAWTFKCLLNDPDALARCEAEATPVTDTARPTLPFIDAVVKESLRLRPVVPMVGRQLRVPVTIRGFTLPAGAVVAPSIWLAHHSPSLFERPDEFAPDRWLDARADIYAFFPFGGGVRRCVGMAFALHEMKVVLTTLLRQASFAHASDSTPGMSRRGITFSVADGCRVRATPRAEDGFAAATAA